jgi:hypothetical protein
MIELDSVCCVKPFLYLLCFYPFAIRGFITLLILTEKKRTDPKREGNMTPAGLGHMMAVCGLVGVDG